MENLRLGSPAFATSSKVIVETKKKTQKTSVSTNKNGTEDEKKSSNHRKIERASDSYLIPGVLLIVVEQLL